jgi:6-phosphogluconolactonase (cycloisomerase 2 family)
MKRPAESYKVFPATVFLVLLVLGFAGQTFADTKPTFVYVANIVPSNPHHVQVFNVLNAIAICAGSQCASPISISASFQVDLTSNQVIGGSAFLTDSSDLKSSPVTLPFDHQGNFAPSAYEYLFFRSPGGTSSSSSVEIVFPFLAFPQNYTGGPLCTTSSAPLCPVVSGVQIGPNDMSAALSASNGTNPISAQVTSGSVPLEGGGPNSAYSGTVSGYAVDSTTGALSPVPGSPFAADLTPGAVAVTPSNKFVYVANNASNNISAYTVDGTTGALTEVSGSPFLAGQGPRSVAIDPSGKFVYVADDTSHNNISAYAIDATTGALTPVPGSPFDTAPTPTTPGWNASSVAVDPSGKFLYVPTQENYVLTYKIDSNTGALTVVSSSFYAAGAQPSTLAVDPSGKFVYVTGSHVVWAYTVDGTTGALTAVSGSPFGPIISYDLSLAIDPLGKFVYVTNADSGNIVAYTLNGTTGALTPIAGSPFASSNFPFSMAIDPSGKFAYVLVPYSHGSIAAYALDGSTGILAPVSGSPFALGTDPTALAITNASPTEPFETFQAKVEIDEDRKTSFRVGGFFTLGKTSNGIDPVSETVELQMGTFSATIPAGAFRKEGKHTFKFAGRINNVDLKMTIDQVDSDNHRDRKDHDKRKDHDGGNENLFTAEGRGDFPTKFVNPVTVGLTIGDYAGSTTVKADIDR